MIQVAIIGDIHNAFDQFDITYFNQSDYDLVLITGDLADFRSQDALEVATLLSQLHKPALLIGGNHDCTSTLQFIAEIKGIEWLAQRDGAGQEQRVEELRRHLGSVILGGYSSHTFVLKDASFAIIAARPFSPGGPEIRIRPYLQRRFAINTLQDSVQLLQQVIDQTAADTLVFLAHNGPTGLGSRKASIWGCDFRPEGGDYGDPDLAEAIQYARAQGKRVAAVVAGHMHHRLADGGQRQWLVQVDGTAYVNAARVPRIFGAAEATLHHHLALTFDEKDVMVEEKLINI